MGKKSKKSQQEDSPPDPEAQAKSVLIAIKNYKQPVFQKVVDLGNDPDFALLKKTMETILADQDPSVQSCSVLLLTAGSTDVACLAHSADPAKIDRDVWALKALSLVRKSEDIPGELIAENGTSRVRVHKDAFSIKEVDTALTGGFGYLKAVGAMVEDDSSDDEGGFNLNDL